MLLVLSDTLVHPLLAMLTHISLYIRKPASPDREPARPAPDAGDPRDVDEDVNDHDLP